MLLECTHHDQQLAQLRIFQNLIQNVPARAARENFPKSAYPDPDLAQMHSIQTHRDTQSQPDTRTPPLAPLPLCPPSVHSESIAERARILVLATATR